MTARERLLEATIACLQELGYARTTTREIVARADLHVPAVNYYFGSKQALLRAAIDEALRRWTTTTMAMDVDPEASPAEQLLARLTRYLETLADDHAYVVAAVEAFAQAERDDEIRAALADAYEQLRAAIVAMLGVDRAAASTIIALLDGFAVQHVIDPEKVPSAPEVALAILGLAQLGGAGAVGGDVAPR